MNTDNFPSQTTSSPGYEAITVSITSDFPSKGCSTCRYFSDIQHTNYGTCHRYPKSETVATEYWCGEWTSLHGMFTK